MLAYIPAPWILWVIVTTQSTRAPLHHCFFKLRGLHTPQLGKVGSRGLAWLGPSARSPWLAWLASADGICGLVCWKITIFSGWNSEKNVPKSSGLENSEIPCFPHFSWLNLNFKGETIDFTMNQGLSGSVFPEKKTSIDGKLMCQPVSATKKVMQFCKFRTCCNYTHIVQWWNSSAWIDQGVCNIHKNRSGIWGCDTATTWGPPLIYI